MKTSNQQSGFSLIELIVSLGVFSVVITTAVGALLALVSANEQLQGEQSIMTNLSFALDSMTREIRTGTDYYCDSSANNNGANNIFSNGNDLDGTLDGTPYGPTQDCAGPGSNENYHGIAFTEGGNSISGASNDRILYFFVGNTDDDNEGKIFRRVGNEDAVSIVSSGLYIHRADFFVTGSTPQSDGGADSYDQASVTISIEASESETTPVEERYNIQTSVTQRTLDI